MALGPARGQPPARPRRTAVLSRAAPGGNGGRRGAGCGPQGEHPFVPLLFRLLPSLGGVSERAELPGREFGDGECAEFSPSRRCPLDEPSTSQPTSPINLAERLPTNLKPTTRSREGTSSPAGSPGSRKGKGKKEEKKKRRRRRKGKAQSCVASGSAAPGLQRHVGKCCPGGEGREGGGTYLWSPYRVPPATHNACSSHGRDGSPKVPGCAEPQLGGARSEGRGSGAGGRAAAARGEGERGRGGHSVIQQGKARPVKMFADVSWEKASFYRSPDGRNVIDRPASLMNGCYSDGDVARLNVKPIVMLF